MSRPSEPLLAWLRKLLQERGLNSAALAERAGLSRSRTRQILTGKQDMSVDELLSISEALELSPTDIGVPMEEDVAAQPPEPGPPSLAAAPEPAETLVEVSPYESHHRQLFEVAFGLGCDFGFTCDTSKLADSKIPPQVLRQQSERMLIQLEARYHEYNKPQYHNDHVTITLSFDALYECVFPWEAIHQVIFTPAALVAPTQAPGSHLRLVT